MKKLLSCVLVSIALVGCSGGEEPQPEPAPEAVENFTIHASNYPLAYFAERIGAPMADVRMPVPGDEDPAHWNPGPDDVLALQGADVVLLNGADYESWLSNVSLPQSKLVVTTDGLEDQLIPLAMTTTHSHGPEGEHEHSGTAFTTWLDPTLAALQAQAVHDAMAARRPEHAARFEAQLAGLTEQLTKLDADVQAAVGANAGIPVLFSHPVYEYLERRYGLNARSLHWEPDRMPDEAAWQKLDRTLGHFPAAWMIWEDTPLPEIRERLESAGVRSVVFDPCATAPAGGDYLSVMERNVEALRAVFAGE